MGSMVEKGKGAGSPLTRGSARKLGVPMRGPLLFLRGSSRDLFVASFLVYAVCVLMDKVSPGFASDFFDLDVLLLVVASTGAAAVLTSGAWGGGENTHRSAAWWTFPAALVLAVSGGVLIYASSPASGAGRTWSALGGGVATAVLFLLLWAERPSVGKEDAGAERSGTGAGEGG